MIGSALAAMHGVTSARRAVSEEQATWQRVCSPGVGVARVCTCMLVHMRDIYLRLCQDPLRQLTHTITHTATVVLGDNSPDRKHDGFVFLVPRHPPFYLHMAPKPCTQVPQNSYQRRLGRTSQPVRSAPILQSPAPPPPSLPDTPNPAPCTPHLFFASNPSRSARLCACIPVCQHVCTFAGVLTYSIPFLHALPSRPRPRKYVRMGSRLGTTSNSLYNTANSSMYDSRVLLSVCKIGCLDSVL